MPTIAELQINLNAKPIEEGVKALNSLADAAERASKANAGLTDTNNKGAPSSSKAAKSEQDLTTAIDAQARKINQLAEQRKALNATDMKTTAPATYERLNRIIDANIALVIRQGNAVEQLNAKQAADAEKQQRQTDAKLRAQERLARSTQRQENIVTNAAAREQRAIDATINGLSRQIAAQNEYNRTIETLNRARTIGNGAQGMMGNPTLSAAEYDSYVKLATAKRDAALAEADNSREIDRSKNKLDSYIATLSRADRAQVEYARAVSVLNANLKNGTITQDQYNQTLQRFADHRDKAIAAANNNAAAEARFSRELRNVVTAYDPVLRAQDNYNAAVKILAQGLQQGSLSVEQFNRALQQQVAALDSVKNANNGTSKLTTEYEQALRTILPYRAELENLAKQQLALDAAKNAGKITTAQQIKDYDTATAAIKRQTDEYKKRIEEGNKAGITFKQEQAALRGLPAQFTDIVVSLQGGQAPLTVLLQQGGQIKDMFGGILPAFKAVGRAVLAMVNPYTVAAAAISSMSLAAYQGASEVREFGKALSYTNGFAGASVNEFVRMQRAMDSFQGTAGKAAEALTLMTSTGKITAETMQGIGEAAIALERVGGNAMKKTIEDFASLGKDPVTAAVRLDEQYRFLTSAILAQADAMVRNGDVMGATVLLQKELAESVKTTAELVEQDVGYMEKAWRGLKDIVTETWNAMKDVGRQGTNVAQMQLDAVQERMRYFEEQNRSPGALKRNERYQELVAEARMLKIRIDQEDQLAKAQGQNDQIRVKAVASMDALGKAYQSSLDPVKRATKDLEVVNRHWKNVQAESERTGKAITAQQREIYDVALKGAEKRLKDAEERAAKAGKGKTTPLDSTDITEAKVNISAVTREYENYYKKINTLGESSVISDEAAFHAKMAILEAEKKAVNEAYGGQIAEIEKLQNRKGNSTSQTISLENQMTKAEEARAKAVEDISARMEREQAKEDGRIQRRKQNIKAYNDALQEQVNNLREEGQRNVESAGMGDRQGALNSALANNDRQRARAQRRLADQLAANELDPVEHAAKLRDLTEAHNEMAEQMIANDKAVQDANFSLYNGWSRATENAMDGVKDLAGLTENMLTSAFDSAGNALAQFVTTGKLNFKDFARSVIADMATMAAKQAAMGALGAIFNIAGAAFMGWMGGGAGALGSAGSSGAATGAVNVGSGISPNVGPGVNFPGFANGGAFSSGTQFFANGGAFTNGIVSSATSFGMSNGRTGVMGEAGPEAIVPLARTSDGKLGIRSTGGAGMGGGGVTVTVIVNSDGGTSTNTDGGSEWQGFGDNLGSYVRQEVYAIINTETRPGGSLQMQQN